MIIILLLATCVSCAAPTPLLPATATPPSPPTLTPTFLPSATPTPLPPFATATLTATPPPPPTSTLTAQLCSPLQDVTLQELPGLVAGNTYQTPMPGRDSGHPGIDLAFYSHGAHKTMLGLPVLAAMPGRVAAVIPNRTPYGNTIILEVPLSSIPASWTATLTWPTPAPTVIPDPRLTCPYPLDLPQWDTSQRSLYLLYGHLNHPSTLHVGDTVTCGQPLGEVGTTGASVNPHLHFEARLGPAGATIDSFGHYDLHVTDHERNNYCLWRVSGWFQVIDPFIILKQLP